MNRIQLSYVETATGRSYVSLDSNVEDAKVLELVAATLADAADGAAKRITLISISISPMTVTPQMMGR